VPAYRRGISFWKGKNVIKGETNIRKDKEKPRLVEYGNEENGEDEKETASFHCRYS
jgi:hypothetical protein